MTNQAQSIVDQEKAGNSVENCHPSLNQETFEGLIERALHLSTTEEELLGSLAEYLASQTIGFAIAVIKEDDHELLLKALYAPNGTNLTSRVIPLDPDSVNLSNF